VFSAGSERPWVTMEEATEQLGVSVAVVRTMVKQGKLPARQIAHGLPWMIERQDMARPEVLARVRDAKLGRKSPREDHLQITMPLPMNDVDSGGSVLPISSVWRKGLFPGPKMWSPARPNCRWRRRRWRC